MTIAASILLYASTILLAATTLWRLKRPIDIGLLVPLFWVALVPVQVIAGGAFRGYTGAVRDNLDLSVSLVNVTMVALQWFLSSSHFTRLSDAVRARFVSGEQASPESDKRLARYWWYGLAVIAVGLASLHLYLMPKIPLFELLTGMTDFYQLASDRENAAKLLDAPVLLKYAFNWDSTLLLPILFCAAVLYKWRNLAIFIGIFGLFYVAAPMDKFPSLLFIMGPFVVLAVRDRKTVFSKILIVGIIVAFIPPYLITESSSISINLHRALHIPIAVVVPPQSATSAPPSGEVPIESIAGVKLPGPVAVFLDLALRRIGQGPADTTYQWFQFFPAVHPFLNGNGWAPWKVLSPGYQNPANMVGLWAYYGKHGYFLTSISAYASFVADGWAEFGFLGVVLACLWLFVFCVVIELMRTFADRPFCLACYGPCLLVLASSVPISGVMAMTFSLGIVFGPLISLGYVLTSRSGGLPMPRLRKQPAAT
ncbi:MAG TPA: hypothetical protein VGU71_15845 [Candidatus Dormibacteraeota bacterium]|nr:hypothetical protein [Candidatus Dormibacteraeota bacterium]